MNLLLEKTSAKENDERKKKLEKALRENLRRRKQTEKK